MDGQPKTLRVFVRCAPPKSTAQGGHMILRRRDGSQFVGRSHNSKAKSTKDNLLALFSATRPKQAFTGPVAVVVDWTYPWRKSEPKRRLALGSAPCDKRPDIDNLCKMFLDVLTTLNYWDDDGQVAQLHFRKWWGDEPGITLEITEIKQGSWLSRLSLVRLVTKVVADLTNRLYKVS